ncbi:MAG: hypothetical protein ACLT4C_09330 [Butyricicoccus sp.]
MIIVIYLVRRTRFRPHFGVLTMGCCTCSAPRACFAARVSAHSDCERQRRVSASTVHAPDRTHLSVGLLLCVNGCPTVFLLIHMLQYRKASAPRGKPAMDSRTVSLLARSVRPAAPSKSVDAQCEYRIRLGVKLRRYHSAGQDVH